MNGWYGCFDVLDSVMTTFLCPHDVCRSFLNTTKDFPYFALFITVIELSLSQ